MTSYLACLVVFASSMGLSSGRDAAFTIVAGTSERGLPAAIILIDLKRGESFEVWSEPFFRRGSVDMPLPETKVSNRWGTLAIVIYRLGEGDMDHGGRTIGSTVFSTSVVAQGRPYVTPFSLSAEEPQPKQIAIVIKDDNGNVFEARRYVVADGGLRPIP